MLRSMGSLQGRSGRVALVRICDVVKHREARELPVLSAARAVDLLRMFKAMINDFG